MDFPTEDVSVSQPEADDSVIPSEYLSAPSESPPSPPSPDSPSGFPTPPRMVTPPPPPSSNKTMEQSSSDDAARETLSFDNPLANMKEATAAAASSNMNGASDEEDDFDFTDADAAIDKMLDDLQDFQDVSSVFHVYIFSCICECVITVISMIFIYLCVEIYRNLKSKLFRILGVCDKSLVACRYNIV